MLAAYVSIAWKRIGLSKGLFCRLILRISSAARKPHLPSLKAKSSFLKQLKKLDPQLVEEVEEKVVLFRNRANHRKLHVHKLKGPLAGFWGFSVNYRFRVIFKWLSKSEAGLLQIGDHSVYN